MKGALAVLCVNSLMAADTKVVLLVGGDVTWSFGFREKSVTFGPADPADADWRAVPRAGSEPADRSKAFDYKIDFGADPLGYPLKRIAPVFHSADLTFVNLETPLTDMAKEVGDYRTPAKFAQAIKQAGISGVTMANNHSYDCEAQGLLDTIANLDAAGLGHVGAGRNLADARRPWIVERNGIRIGVLGYAQFSNLGEHAFAAAAAAGVAPMDLGLIKEDIQRLRSGVDYVAVAFHWGSDKSNRVSPKNREFAHQVIDDGADMVFGGHTPFAKGIEVYRGKVIVYSPAHVIAGHQHVLWGDNYLVRFTLAPKAIGKVEVLPLAGTGEELAQPYLLDDARAAKLLQTIRELSAALDTKMEIRGNVGVIMPAP